MIVPEYINDVMAHATCIHSKAAVEAALDKMAVEISDKLADANPLFLCVVVGGIIPLGNLLPRLNFPLAVDYVHASRYQGELTGGELRWKAKPSIPLKDRNIVIVDDILDTGLTLAAIAEYCKQEGANTVYTAVLVDKKDARKPGGTITADFTGLEVENRYVFGYGLDYKEYLRNAPGIYVVAPQHEG